MKSTIHSNRNVDINTIISEANDIWHVIQTQKQDNKPKLTADLQKEYKDFHHSYPIVLYFMIECKLYHQDALREYIIYTQSHPAINESVYLDLQTRYVAILLRFTSKLDQKEIEQIRLKMVDELQKESNDFKIQLEKMSAKAKEKEMIYKNNSKKELMQFVKRYANLIYVKAGTISLDVSKDIDSFKQTPLLINDKIIDYSQYISAECNQIQMLGNELLNDV